MKSGKSFIFKAFTSFLLGVFTFTNIAYSQQSFGTLSVPKNVFEITGTDKSFNYSDRDEDMPAGPERFKKSVRQDMKRITMAMFFIEKIRPWDLPKDPEKSRIVFETRIGEALKALGQLRGDPESAKLLQIILESSNIRRIGEKGNGLEIPFNTISIRIFREEEADKEEEPGGETIGTFYYRISKKQGKDLKGKEAPETDPIIQTLIENRKIIEVYLDAETEKLKAKRVRAVRGHEPGETSPEEYLGYEVKIEQLFNEEEKANLTKWMKTHKIRGEPCKFRIVLGNAALGWQDGAEHSNISHAGVRDKAIYMGHLLLKKLMDDRQDQRRKSILDEDEYRHLKGLYHGTEKEAEKRIVDVSGYIERQEKIAETLKTKDIDAIKKIIAEILTDKENQKEEKLLEVLSVWNSVSLRDYKFPVESLYPVKKAIALMTVEEQEKILEILTRALQDSRYRDLRVTDEIMILLEDPNVSKKWIEKNAAELKGRTIWQVSPEIWHEAGGLARVMQYHGVGIKDLTGDSDVKLKMVEPHYQYRIDTDGIAQKFNYEKDITHPFISLKTVDLFTIFVGGKEEVVQVSKGVNDLGVESYLIRDVQPGGGSFYTHSLYNYRQGWERESNLPTWEEFSVFYSKAAFEFIQREEAKDLERKTAEKRISGSVLEWKAPIIHTNDSQTALVGIYAFAKREEARARKEEDPDFELDPVLEHMIIAFTTHTYNNRTDYPIAEGQGDNLMNFMEIPEKYREFLKHYKDEGHYYYSMASGGLRTADWQGAVGRTHMEDVSIYDEWITGTEDKRLKDLFNTYGAEVDLIAVSNGDNIHKTAEVFRSIGKEMAEASDTFGQFDPKNPTAKQVREIKKTAKARLTLEMGMREGKHYYSSQAMETSALLDPENPVISYSGRLVPEKAGRNRAFTDGNIEKLVEKGYQVVIYGNVQTKNGQSSRLKQEFIELSQRLKEKNYPGRFIFAPRFSLQDQRALLAATDIQVQDSDVRKTGWPHKKVMGTEAAGYTEANISACGGLQLAPPREGNGEGLLTAQGIPIDLEILGKGNTLIPGVKDPKDPSTWTSKAYLDILMKTLDKGLDNLAHYQVTSIKLSSVLNARLTAAEYLRQFSMAVKNKEQKEQRRRRYVKKKKEREEKMKLINQVKVPDPAHEPEEYAVYSITEQIMARNVKEAVKLFLTNRSAKDPEGYKKAAAAISNNFLAYYPEDGSTGELFRGFAGELKDALFQVMPESEEYIAAVKDIQVITGQTLTIMSWIDRHVPGAEKIRIATEEERTATSKKGNSFIDKNTFPERVPEVKTEGDKGFFWRGVEGVKKIGNNIVEEGINTESVRYKSLQAMKDKMVLYLMDHGFIEVPDSLREATDKKRITTVHETAFLNDMLPLSNQMTSTGPGHFQGNGLDIKYITEGKGEQINVLYNDKNEIKDVVVQHLEEGTWTVALPGYVDFMINLGGLRFNDISVSLSDEEARKFNPAWGDGVKDAGIKPETAPVMAIGNSPGEGFARDMVFVRNKELSAEINISKIPGNAFSEVMGKMFSLTDVYLFKLSGGEKEIDRMVELFLEAKNKEFAKKEPMDNMVSENELQENREKESLLSLGKTKGVFAFLEDNDEFLEKIFVDEIKTTKLLRIALETIEQDEGSGIKDFIRAIGATGKFHIQLFYAEEPNIEVLSATYDKYGIKKTKTEDLQERAKGNTLTILPVGKGEEFTPSEANVCWKKLGDLAPGKKCTAKDTIVLPVGYNYDSAGLVRSIILGLRLCEIAQQNYDIEHPFVSYTYAQYKDFCLSQGVDQKVFTLTKEDIFNMAGSVGIKAFTLSLNSLIRSLPIVPFNIEEMRAIHERAKEAMIRA